MYSYDTEVRYRMIVIGQYFMKLRQKLTVPYISDRSSPKAKQFVSGRQAFFLENIIEIRSELFLDIVQTYKTN